jgi:D-glycero-D-manno-heptose 1,7-bisphosphate phosphatase
VKRAAFLDRDGVINASIKDHGIPIPPRSLEEVVILEGVEEAVQLLKLHNFLPIVVSNQPDVARGITSYLKVSEINRYIGEKLDIQHFYVCFHDDKDLCVCRKPLPGLIKSAATQLDLNISSSFLVGDRWRDIEAGQRAGCKTFFIDYSYPETQPESPFTRVSSLLEAVEIMTGANRGTQ